MTRSRGRPAHGDVLTPAEWRVVDGVRHGFSTRALAVRHGVSPDAIKFHIANALAKLGFSSRVQLRRWGGVRRDSALFSKETTMTDTLAIGPIGQIARSVKAIAAASHWYGEVLGLPHLYTFGNLAFFDCGGTRLMLSAGDGGPAESILYFQVADIHAAKATLEGRGAEFTHAPHMIQRHADGTEEWMAILKDNEDRPLAIMAQAKS